MELALTLAKMPTYYTDRAHYLLKGDQDFLKMNALLGKELHLRFLDQKFCASCGNQFSELFRMGFCRNCFFTKPEAGESIIRPELSRAHQGVEDRDLTFEKAYQLQPHVVYLANSGGLKVGVTRQAQKLHRWIDQGASYALVFGETSNRYEAGQLEVALKEHIGDKTPWQRMLKNEVEDIDLVAEKHALRDALNADLRAFVTADEKVQSLSYPVLEYPHKVKSLNLNKQPEITAVLQGIKGQYLIFEGGLVFNVRSNTGYRVSFSFS